ncbi:hypothetical protein [Micromonospora sp. C95]|uniref:hypothetical protein n=1 Tax=Micromonospora sp. C95 TaxID=2824882 RepID=UPI001B37C08B|nr:hypothetical protein [Micromonospora sp. C95]MBQ1022747.1 hypothetical protein [Micromonospora sp. C95]
MGVSTAAGSVALVGAALAAAAVFEVGELPARVMVIAAVVGMFAARVADLRAVAVVTVLAAAIFVGFSGTVTAF